MSEPAALDLAAIREVLDDEYLTPSRAAFLTLVDELERCRAERDALRAALEKLVWASELDCDGSGDCFCTDVENELTAARALSRHALGGVTQ